MKNNASLFAYKISWYESERGWGQKLFSVSFHLTKELADRAINEHHAHEKRRNPSGEVPEWYIFPYEPQATEVTEEEYEEAQDDAKRKHHFNFPEYEGE